MLGETGITLRVTGIILGVAVNNWNHAESNWEEVRETESMLGLTGIYWERQGVTGIILEATGLMLGLTGSKWGPLGSYWE